MKPKIKTSVMFILSGAVVVLSGVFFLGKHTLILAADKELKSTGNLLFEQKGSPEAAIYASDIKYLQEELNSLFNEIQ